MEQSVIIAAAIAGFIGVGLGFITCALFTTGKAADLLDEIDRLHVDLAGARDAKLIAEADRDFHKSRLARLTDRDARGRFVKAEGKVQ